MIPSSTDIHYFVAIAETRNLSRASEKLGVVQPTLSQSVKRLEASVGHPLFLREKNGMTLTKTGEAFLTNCRSLLGEWDRILQDVTGAAKDCSGTFRLGCHPSVAMYTLGPFLPSVLKEPKIQIRLEHGLSREMTEKVISRALDFALVINPVHHDDLVLKKLCTDRVGFWRAPGAPQDVVIYDPALRQSQDLLRKITKQTPFGRHLVSGNLEVVAELAGQGCGVGILPERVAARYPRLSPFSSHWFRDELYLAYRADTQKTAGFQFVVREILKAKI